MGLLDFLKVPKWKEAQSVWEEEYEDELEDDDEDYVGDNFMTEDDYWSTDENKIKEPQVCLQEFYNQCKNDFEHIAKEENVLSRKVHSIDEIRGFGEIIVTSNLHDKYLVQRKSTQAHIFYGGQVDWAMECGIIMAREWMNTPANIENYTNKIIFETPIVEFSNLLKADEIVWSEDIEVIRFSNKISRRWRELLEIYYKNNNFEQYVEKALLAVFELGVAIYYDKNIKQE